VKDQQAAGDPDREAEDIEGGVGRSSDQAAPGELQVIYEHIGCIKSFGWLI
jgi:hypothetical protein